jgi:hypothetical protein
VAERLEYGMVGVNETAITSEVRAVLLVRRYLVFPWVILCLAGMLAW